MDDGPFRVSQPANRRSVNRPEPTARWQAPEEPQKPVAAEPKPVAARTAPTQHTSKKEKKASKKFKLPILAAIILILILLGFFAWSKMQNTGTAIDTSKYQAVFFTNGQVYFGKLESFNKDYMKLSDIYYLQTQTDTAKSENPQQTSTDQNNVQLIKLGDEIHGPEDEMVISRDQVLFYENLKEDGKVTQSIGQYKKTTK